MTTRTVTIANRGNATYAVDARRPLLHALRDQGVDLPYGCKYGGCITCAAKLTEGEVDQRRQVALNNRQINDGYVILCVARPVSDITLEIGVESHDRLYRNPFLTPLQPHELKADIATPAPASRDPAEHHNTASPSREPAEHHNTASPSRDAAGHHKTASSSSEAVEHHNTASSSSEAVGHHKKA